MNAAIPAVVGSLVVTALMSVVLAQRHKAVAPIKGIRITGRVVDVLKLPLPRTTVTLTGRYRGRQVRRDEPLRLAVHPRQAFYLYEEFGRAAEI